MAFVKGQSFDVYFGKGKKKEKIHMMITEDGFHILFNNGYKKYKIIQE